MFENNVYVQNFNKYTFLLTELIKRDISGKYKDSTLGLFWSFLNPLLSMIVLTMVFSLIFANTIENFPVYLLSGKLVFDLFANATTGAMDSIKANSEIIKKIYVPKYMFAVGIVCSEFINFLISLVVLVAVMIFTGAPFHFALIYSPIPLFFLLVLTMGVGLILATATTFFTDIKYLYGVLVMLLSFMTPLFYPIDIIPQQFLFAYKLNPLYSAVECFRNIILGGTFPDTPIPLFFLLVLTMGVGLILATATTFFTDIKYLYGVLVMLLSFMTPLFYPIDIIPQQFLFAYKLNPLYSAVECFRNIILGGTFPDTWPFVFLIVTSIISLVIGVYVFFKYQDKFVLNI